MKIMLIVLTIVVLSACSKANITTNQSLNNTHTTNQPVTVQKNTQSSFPYPLVKWNNVVYRITNDAVVDVDAEIGEIATYSTTENNNSQDNFSNYFKIGTKIWSIKDVDKNEAIAIESEAGKYIKAVTSKTQ
ncbi:hypothetical protein [Cohnella silvisoli]|uniref:DUF3221 domain-containing protein n=1 Tax=Cohnella silvisoli TaxID=2873699 RepID=A0ABV1KWT4_9BACL|nr:hypothetical protein [Cohnella silvisoli]MCD9023891.1 hypothetical protein [Cohnella silvisoli]